MAYNANQIVDPLEAACAISEIQGMLNCRGMSTTDLAVELGWKRNKVEQVLYGVDIPILSDLQKIAKVLDFELDIQLEE